MAQRGQHTWELSARRIFGFACNQAFAFFLFYLGSNWALGTGFDQAEGANPAQALGSSGLFDRADLAFILVFMVLGFGLVRAFSRETLQRLFARPLLYIYAVVMAVGSLAPYAMGQGIPDFALFAAQGALVGLPCSFLLTAWGRTFGGAPISSAVPEVFIGSLVAALLCLLFSLVPSTETVLVAIRILPLASVVNIDVPAAAAARPATVEPGSAEGRELSLKILAGTALFGAAAGLMEAFAAGPAGAAASGVASAGVAADAAPSASAGAAAPYCSVAFLLFGAFAIGALTLLLSQEHEGESSNESPRPSTTSAASSQSTSLNRAYRLAVFMMMAGILVVPWPLLAESPIPGPAIELGGYLGLEAVLISIFLVLANVTSRDSARSFSEGFTSLFAGEVLGVVIANVARMAAAGDVASAAAEAATFSAPYLVVVLAGVLVLLSYIFLFTEREFDELTQIVKASDTFEDVCESITTRYALSKRESEILAYALRGRTSERIAGELVISKSTVDTHLRRIYAKCGVHSRQELLDLAEKSIAS